jgi:hypothetical protein
LKAGGGSIQAVGIDGSNERYYADGVRKSLEAAGFTVVIVVSGETVENPDNPKAKIRRKEKLGCLLVNFATDRLLALPSDKFIKDDFLLQKKEKGLFVCDLDTAGNHGDTFDSTKLSIFALESAGEVEVMTGIRLGGWQQQEGRDPRPSWARDTMEQERHYA